MKEIPLLKPSDIEVRVQSKVFKNRAGEPAARFLLYKPARTDMRILDEVFGPMNWKRSQEVINGALYCTISVYDPEKKEWVSKQDVGVPSKQDPQKGAASDAFKRAGTNWGIGRELYDAPDIIIDLNMNELYNGNIRTGVRFIVSDVEYDREAHEFKRLILVDKQGQVRFMQGKRGTTPQKRATQNNPVKNDSQQFSEKDKLSVQLGDRLAQDGVDLNEYSKKCFGVSFSEMNEKQIRSSLERYDAGLAYYRSKAAV